MNSFVINRDDVRRRAEEKLAKVTKRATAIVTHQQQQRESEAIKIERLRALRAARDASLEQARPGAAPEKAASPRTKRATKAEEDGEPHAAAPADPEAEQGRSGGAETADRTALPQVGPV